ncbi:MAG: alpha/beta hydrolase-fold protein [Planctomycetota bacterium]|nr:alpha/beta hydrolase-fold protein [Planctomycetota bacterium]
MTPQDRSERLRIDLIHAKHLEKNKLGDPADRNLAVLLPPSYHRSKTRRYPVAYLLHGFGGSAWSWATDFSTSAGPKWRSFVDSVDDFMRRRKCDQMIIVMPDGWNRWGCSQWVDSGINGNYASYVAEDVVNFVDKNYRTVAERSHRMVAGVSSGGIGAFHVGGSNPHVFGAAGIRSADIYFEVTHVPWLVSMVNASYPEGFAGPISGNGNSWFCYGLSAAYSPNPRKAPWYCDLPMRSPTCELIDDVWQKWLRFDPLVAYKDYLEGFRSMHIYTDCGSRDEFQFHLGHRILHERFEKARLRHVYEEFDGTHGNKSNERSLRTLQWFSSVLPGAKKRKRK